MNIGVREFRDGLSSHLASVREGHIITVTDHGRPVARVLPVDRPTALERLVAEGKVTPASKRRAGRPEPIDSDSTVSDLVTHQRR